MIVFFFPDNPFPAGYSSFHGSRLVISTPKDNCLSIAGGVFIAIQLVTTPGGDYSPFPLD
ncbi:MAG: hypothetical protein NZ901_02075 [Geminocystis sp.]|nr:hypothetical protein [Geminocystis sp.]MCS7146958.1 hypothetical protein [Geminocystis sp.]MDW8115782.1 hypothetical protein [Geminocystis sp.]MDW8463325.1 hypothetical protein [Geminocystis sp.]